MRLVPRGLLVRSIKDDQAGVDKGLTGHPSAGARREDGVQDGDPHQIAEDLEREELARVSGAKEFVFYQLSRADSHPGGWDTGIE